MDCIIQLKPRNKKFGKRKIYFAGFDMNVNSQDPVWTPNKDDSAKYGSYREAQSISDYLYIQKGKIKTKVIVEYEPGECI